MELQQATLAKKTVFDDHFIYILQVPLVDKSLIMDVYKVYTATCADLSVSGKHSTP